jgi:ubiquinol-cytochrome c reductase core subunit 2
VRSWWQGTKDRSSLAITRESERDGTQLSVAADRETITYTAKFLDDNIQAAVENVSDAAIGQLFDSWEVDEVKALVGRTPDPEQAVIDALHTGAFRATLGRSPITAGHRVPTITPQDLLSFTVDNYTGGNISVIGSGVDHAALVELVENSFADVAAGDDIPPQPAAYYGGFESRVDAAADAAYFGIGFKGAAAGAPNAPAMQVLSAILGAPPALKWGSAASANKLSAVVAAASATATVTSFNASYSDAGIVGIIVKAAPDQSHAAVSAASNALKAVLGGDISPDDVTKAKNKIALAVLDASSAEVLNSFAHQLLTTKQLATPEESAAAIQAVTVADVLAAAKSVGECKPTYAAYGNIGYAPYADEL